MIFFYDFVMVIMIFMSLIAEQLLYEYIQGGAMYSFKVLYQLYYYYRYDLSCSECTLCMYVVFLSFLSGLILTRTYIYTFIPIFI